MKDFIFCLGNRRLILDNEKSLCYIDEKLTDSSSVYKKTRQGRMKLFKKSFKLLIVLMTSIFLMSALFACKGSGENDDSLETEGQIIYVMPSRFTNAADRSDRKNAKREWNKISSYFINTGNYHAEMLKYDLGIVDPDNISAEQLASLKAAGVWTVAQIKLSEDDFVNTGDAMGPGGIASYYIFEGGRPVQNSSTGGYYTDPQNKTWRNIVLAKAEAYLDLGYDGLYLSGLDSIERYPDTANGMCGFIKLISESFPDAKHIGGGLGGGLKVFPTIHPYLDAALFDGFYTYYDSRLKEDHIYEDDAPGYIDNLKTAVKIINAVRQESYMPIFSLEYAENVVLGGVLQMIYNHDYQYDFIPYIPLGGRDLNGDVTGHKLIPTVNRGTKALLMPDIKEPVINGDVSEYNLAYVGNGGKIFTDSVYTGYIGGTAINDGYIGNAENYDLIDWSKIAWASADNDKDHWIEIVIPAAQKVTSLEIYWAYEPGMFHSSQNVTIQAYIAGQWQKIGEALNIEENTGENIIELDCPSEVTRVRIFQAAGNGPFARDGIMWVTQVGLYA